MCIRDRDGLFLGPILRTDLCHTARITEYASSTTTELTAARLALVISRIPDSPLVADAVFELGAARATTGLPLIDACWLASEIATGTPYTTLFGPDNPVLTEAGLPDNVAGGTISSVVAQPTMAPLLALGALPELDREHTRSFFDACGPIGCMPDSRTLASIYGRGQRLVDALSSDPGNARAEVQRACDVLRTATAGPFIGDEAWSTSRDLSAATHDLEHVAAVLTRNPLRDSLIATALDHPFSAGAVLVDIARNYNGVIRCNALCIWALIAVKLKLTSWASAALECAQEEIPEHSLSYYLAQLLRAGAHESLIKTALRGCGEAWELLEGRAGAK